MSTQAALSEVFDLLLAGSTLTLQFPNTNAADTFRSALYKYKKKTEGQMEDVGIDFDISSLGWQLQQLPNQDIAVKMWLYPKEETKYTILSVVEAEPIAAPVIIAIDPAVMPATVATLSTDPIANAQVPSGLGSN